MGLDVLLEILGPLERLAAEVALVRLEGHMDADVRGDVVALDRGSAALVPLAGEVQVVGALAANMLLADVLLGDELAIFQIFSFFSSFHFHFRLFSSMYLRREARLW